MPEGKSQTVQSTTLLNHASLCPCSLSGLQGKPMRPGHQPRNLRHDPRHPERHPPCMTASYMRNAAWSVEEQST